MYLDALAQSRRGVSRRVWAPVIATEAMRGESVGDALTMVVGNLGYAHFICWTGSLPTPTRDSRSYEKRGDGTSRQRGPGRSV